MRLDGINMLCWIFIVLTLALSASSANADWSKRGDIKIQAQAFTDNALHSATQSSNFSASGTAEFNREIGENGNLTISPFIRIDQHDDSRTHVDLREFLYRHSGETWEMNIGLGKVFWGVAESNNIVDIINQKDAIEGTSPEHKLGQPMVNLLLLKDWGEVSLFVLPGFRERTFASKDGRPRGFFPIDTDNPLFQSDKKQNHIDVAGRISGAINQWDWGLHAFHGTAREPQLIISDSPLNLTIKPFYYQLTQVGIDVQATLESWLLKTELVHKSGSRIDDHMQLVSGFEYSFYSVAESDVDVGIVVEWLYDERTERADTVFQNDMLMGLRFALNDEQSSEALIGVITDLDGGGDLFSAEASRRIGDKFKLQIEALIWANADNDSVLSQFQQEDYLQLELGYFF